MLAARAVAHVTVCGFLQQAKIWNPFGNATGGYMRRYLHGAAVFAIACSAAIGVLAPAPAVAFPERPVTLIVPWPAGGSTDIAMRTIAKVAAKHLGQPIVIENRSGASGTLGPSTMAAAAKPDGYTITQSHIAIVRFPIMQKASFDPIKDFTYIARLSGYTFGITAKSDGPFKSWADVVAYAKANPEKVTYGTPGVGTSLHIGMEQIAAREGIKLTHVPFKGAAETSTAVLGGHTTLQVDSTGWKPHVDSGKLRLLAIWTAERSKNWPDSPTLRELGYPYVFDSPFGIAGPKGMDPKVVKVLHDAFKNAIEDPTVVEALRTYDMVPRYLDSEEYRKSMEVMAQEEKDAIVALGLARKE
jgi:tripartite-type tricarboxylate transporter receptor subunit TctC